MTQKKWYCEYNWNLIESQGHGRAPTTRHKGALKRGVKVRVLPEQPNTRGHTMAEILLNLLGLIVGVTMMGVGVGIIKFFYLRDRYPPNKLNSKSTMRVDPETGLAEPGEPHIIPSENDD